MDGKDTQLLLREACLKHGVDSVCLEGEYLAFENDMPVSAFFVVSGKLRLSSTSEDGREFLFGTVREGRIVGASCLLSASPYPYSIKGTEPGTIIKISIHAWRDILLAHPGLSTHLIKIMSQEQNILIRRLKSIVFYSVEKRMTLYLLKRCSIEGKKVFDHTLVLHFSREDLSSVLGTTRESISRALSSLARNGLISVRGKYLEIISLEKLAEYVN